MLTVDRFLELVPVVMTPVGAPPRPLNDEQRDCVGLQTGEPLMIVAGPGSGKTAVLVLRALRHLLVDGFLPEEVVVTTFTRKAADEIRTRLLEWGRAFLDLLVNEDNPALQAFLGQVDLNRFVTGTLDSLSQNVMGERRRSGEVPPNVIEGFAANQILKFRGGLNRGVRDIDAGRVNLYFDTFSPRRNRYNRNAKDLVKAAREVIDRMTHDLVDTASFGAAEPFADVRQMLCNVREQYYTYLRQSGRYDFALLELEFLQRLLDGEMDASVVRWRALLVDEYQDTNALQEAIYFGICQRAQIAFTVVGDDDQSLYRFRGATVELFREFVARAEQALQVRPQIRWLHRNYRSTGDIVGFYNGFVACDAEFQAARVAGKPPVTAEFGGEPFPILGMFRPTRDDLARDLAGFLFDVFRTDGGYTSLNNADIVVRRSDTGDFGDSVLLAHRASETNTSGDPRLPLLLRRELSARGVEVFNPRGESIETVPIARELLGLMLEALDPASANWPNGQLCADLQRADPANGVYPAFGRDVAAEFAAWRATARTVDQTQVVGGRRLSDVVRGWSVAELMGGGEDAGGYTGRDRPLSDLFFQLISYLPTLRTRSENQVYMEAIARSVAEAAAYSRYQAQIVREQFDESRSAAIRDVLVPIAQGELTLDEDTVPNVPRSVFPIMTIHQSKGLEFPLTIVDVASDFRTNHHLQKMFRFPEAASNTAMLESQIDPHTPIRGLRTARSDLHRTFEDLVRLYYVAYSRPQRVLLLVGLLPCINGRTNIKSVPLHWRFDSSWPWENAGNTIADVPFEVI